MNQQTLTESPVAEQLRRGFRRLRFETDLEAAYRVEQFQGGLRFLRVSLAIVGVSLLIVFQMEQVAMPGLGSAPPHFPRIDVMVPMTVLAFALTFIPRAETWYPRVMTALLPIALMVIAWVSLWAWGLGENRLFARLIIATIATYFLFGLPLRSSLVASLIAIGFYAAAAIAAALPALDLANAFCMLFIANLMCAAGAYNMEHTRRTAWLEARMLDEVAQRDGLTGLYNRRRFDEHLANVWQNGIREHRPVTLLLVDIDYFKAFNDRYGHQAGDEAMKAVAAVLSHSALRPFDLVARYGGEEFAIVLHDTTQAHAMRAAEQLLEAVRALGIPHQDSSAAAVLTISVGVAVLQPVAGRSSAGLIQRADQALYAAKDAGRNRMHVPHGDYEHMKTGYFQRRAGGPENSQ